MAIPSNQGWIPSSDDVYINICKCVEYPYALEHTKSCHQLTLLVPKNKFYMVQLKNNSYRAVSTMRLELGGCAKPISVDWRFTCSSGAILGLMDMLKISMLRTSMQPHWWRPWIFCPESLLQPKDQEREFAIAFPKIDLWLSHESRREGNFPR